VTTDPAGALPPTTVSYAYDELGNRTQLTYPDSDVVSYAYDALNHLTQLTSTLHPSP
jgi:YD repeat-containing protein